jgi:hypothetical protein
MIEKMEVDINEPSSSSNNTKLAEVTFGDDKFPEMPYSFSEYLFSKQKLRNSLILLPWATPPLSIANAMEPSGPASVP